MSNRDEHLDYEENFFSKGKRESRKERKHSQNKDRSKYKKTDREKQKETPTIQGGQKKGRVLSLSPQAITVADREQTYICTLKGVLKKEKTKQKNLIVVGDWVQFDSINADQGVITHVEKRKSFLARSDNLRRRKEQLLAVNIDQVFIVMSVMAPKFKPLLIDRYVIAARRGNIEPIVVVNKMDFFTTPPENTHEHEVEEEKALLLEFLNAYKALNIPVLCVSCITKENLETLKQKMAHTTSVFSGQSGVGKSSLINAVIGSSLPTGDVVSKTRKGSHTTTGASLIPIHESGFCVDTPGIRSFAIWDLSPEEITAHFTDFSPYNQHCKFPNCTHRHEPNCAVKEAVDDGKISPLRYRSYLTLMENKPLEEWE